MKRKISIASIFISIVLILLSIEKVTMVGLLEGRCTIYQTISTSGEAFNLVANKISTNATGYIIMFFVAIALLFVPCFVLFNQSKVRNTFCIVISTIGTICTFVFFKSCQFMYLMIVICLMILSNILICMIRSYKSRFVWFISAISVLICFLNIYYLISHLQMRQFWDNGILNGNLDAVVEEMVEISIVNMIFFFLWLIPCVILFCRDFITKRKEEV